MVLSNLIENEINWKWKMQKICMSKTKIIHLCKDNTILDLWKRKKKCFAPSSTLSPRRLHAHFCCRPCIVDIRTFQGFIFRLPSITEIEGVFARWICFCGWKFVWRAEKGEKNNVEMYTIIKDIIYFLDHRKMMNANPLSRMSIIV